MHNGSVVCKALSKEARQAKSPFTYINSERGRESVVTHNVSLNSSNQKKDIMDRDSGDNGTKKRRFVRNRNKVQIINSNDVYATEAQTERAEVIQEIVSWKPPRSSLQGQRYSLNIDRNMRGKHCSTTSNLSQV